MCLLVTLIVTCFSDVIYFTTYLMIWMIAMTIAYKVLGMEANGYSKLDDNTFVNYFIQVWENGIGNINPPAFLADDPSSLRVFAVYSMWFATQFVVLIVLLNFLIAVISQSYENVMDSSDILTYSARCAFNSETFPLKSFIGKDLINKTIANNCIIVTVPDQEAEGQSSEWAGFVQTLKMFIKKQNGRAEEKMNAN